MQPTTLLQKNEHRLLALMLLSLLAANWPDNSLQISQGFLIAHFGFFLLWQPLIKQQQSFSLLQLGVLLALIFGFIYWFSPWLNLFWCMLLLSLLSGRIFARGLSRLAYGLAVIFLFLYLALISIPDLFFLPVLSSSLRQPVYLLLCALPAILLFLPAQGNISHTIDLIRGFFFMLLTGLLLMASILIGLVSGQPYLPSLLLSLGLLIVFLLLAAFLWSPRGSFSGFARLWEKYLLNLGGPFEQWILHIDTLATSRELPADAFLSAAARSLLQHHWVRGISWNTPTSRGKVGAMSGHEVRVCNEQITLRLSAHMPVGPVMLLHAKLLLNILAFYYRAKLQEQELVKQAHMQAIYETGSKLTHDVKNVLQSIGNLGQIVNDRSADEAEIIAILQKQMPLLSQRLNTTLEKLREPARRDAPADSGSMRRWWQQLQQGYSDRNIEFSSTLEHDTTIPLDLFTTVAENLLDNAEHKRRQDKNLQIKVELDALQQGGRLRVSDNGQGMADEIAAVLFKEIITSSKGFGIGLYQCAALARKHNYQLRLLKNQDACVSFELAPLQDEHQRLTC